MYVLYLYVCSYLLANLCFIFFIYSRSPSSNTNFLPLWRMHLFSFFVQPSLYRFSCIWMKYCIIQKLLLMLDTSTISLSELSSESDIRSISHTSWSYSWCFVTLLLNRSLEHTHAEKFKLYIVMCSTKSLNHTHAQLATSNYFTWRSRRFDEKTCNQLHAWLLFTY